MFLSQKPGTEDAQFRVRGSEISVVCQPRPAENASYEELLALDKNNVKIGVSAGELTSHANLIPETQSRPFSVLGFWDIII